MTSAVNPWEIESQPIVTYCPARHICLILFGRTVAPRVVVMEEQSPPSVVAAYQFHLSTFRLVSLSAVVNRLTVFVTLPWHATADTQAGLAGAAAMCSAASITSR